jgi:hypothetical protein
LCKAAAARRIAEEVFNEHNVDALDEILDPDIFYHEAIPELRHGIGVFKEAVRWVLAAFPDLRYDTEDIVAEGD